MPGPQALIIAIILASNAMFLYEPYFVVPDGFSFRRTAMQSQLVTLIERKKSPEIHERVTVESVCIS